MISMQGAVKWGVRVAGGLGGYAVSTKFVTPSFPAGKSFLGLPVVSGADALGWDDVTDVAFAITAGGLAGKLAGAVFNRKKKK